jgi:hypothetical protein
MRFIHPNYYGYEQRIMKAMQLLILFIFFISCNELQTKDISTCLELFESEDSIKYTTAYFFTEDSQYFELSEKYYLPKARIKEPFFIEKTYLAENDSIRFSIHKIFKFENCNSTLLVEEISFMKDISLYRNLWVFGQKYYRQDSLGFFTSDTIASPWLRRKNRLVLDSMLFNLKGGWYICGTSQQELLQKDFPNSKTSEITRDSALSVISQYIK